MIIVPDCNPFGDVLTSNNYPAVERILLLADDAGDVGQAGDVCIGILLSSP